MFALLTCLKTEGVERLLVQGIQNLEIKVERDIELGRPIVQ
jgi:hypothetical protein